MKKSAGLLLLTVIISLTITFICQKDGVFNTFFVADDVRRFLPAVYAFDYALMHEAFLKDDLVLKYMVAKDSPGHLALYRLFAVWFDPFLLTKILPFLLCALSGAFLFKIGEVLGNVRVGFIAALIFSFYVWTSHFGYFSGGLPKAFAFPLLLAFVWAFSLNRLWVCFALLLVQVLFYPAMAILSLGIYACTFFRKMDRGKAWALIFVLSAVSVFFVAHQIYNQPDMFLGERVVLKEMVGMPEFGLGGRNELFVPGIWRFLTSENASGVIMGIPMLFLLGFCGWGALYLGRGFFRLPSIIFDIFFASLSCFILAWVCLFYLSFPGRYFEYSLPVCIVLVIALALDKFFICVPARKWRWIAVMVLVVVHAPYLKTNLINCETKMLHAVKALPDDSLVAGHPYDMDPVLLFAKKRVLIQFEVSTAWHKNYYAQVKERTVDFFKAYYSDSMDEVLGFCRKYGITHLVVNAAHFDDEYLDEGNFYIKPFNGEIAKIVARNKDRFILRDKVLDSKKIPAGANDFFILKMRDFLKGGD